MRAIFILAAFLPLLAGAAPAAEPVVLSSKLGADANLKPRVAAKSGVVIVVWQSNPKIDWDVFAAVSRDRGYTFAEPMQINDDSTQTDQMNPDVAASVNGDAYIVWQDKRNAGSDPFGGDFDLYFALLANGSVKQPKNRAPLKDNAGSQIYPRVSLQGGDVAFVWLDDGKTTAADKGVSWDVRFARSSDLAASFSSAVAVNAANDAFNTDASACFEPDGTLDVVWYDWSAKGNKRAFNSDSSPKADAEKLDASSSSAALKPACISGAGGKWVVWQDDRDYGSQASAALVGNDGQYYDIYGAFFADGALSSPSPVVLNSNRSLQQLQPALCGDKDRTYLCFADNSAVSHFEIRCGELANGALTGEKAVWPHAGSGTEAENAISASNQFYPSCAFDGTALHVVWQQDNAEGGTDAVYLKLDKDAFKAAKKGGAR